MIGRSAALATCFFVGGSTGGVASAHDKPLEVIGEIERSYGPYPDCGILHVIGEADIHVQKAPAGMLATDHIVVEMSCPSGWRVHEVRRLTLSARRPNSWPRLKSQSSLTNRWYVLSSKPF